MSDFTPFEAVAVRTAETGQRWTSFRKDVPAAQVAAASRALDTALASSEPVPLDSRGYWLRAVAEEGPLEIAIGHGMSGSGYLARMRVPPATGERQEMWVSIRGLLNCVDLLGDAPAIAAELAAFESALLWAWRGR